MVEDHKPTLPQTRWRWLVLLTCGATHCAAQSRDGGAQGNATKAASVRPWCPAPYQKVGGHCFWISQSLHTFESCQRDVCGPRGGSLACIRRFENERLAWRIGLGRAGPDFLPVWMGYSHAAGSWAWTGTACRSTWTNWLPGDPDSYCGGEDCAAMTPSGGRWTDLSCRMRLPCLCEYGLTLTRAYNSSVARLRDDTCYVGCGGLARWCSAWPFPSLYMADRDVCHWEQKDGQRRGRGARECVVRASTTPGCGAYASYSVGHCSCSPAAGRHMNCSNRESDAASDVFKLTPGGAQLVHPGQRCAYNLAVDEAHFAALRPESTRAESARLWLRASAVWLVVGAPCAAVMALVGLALGCTCRGPRLGTGPGPGPGGGAPGGAVYGPLFVEGADDGASASEAVHRWILRAAVGSIAYGLALLGLGAALAAHVGGGRFSFLVELLCSLAMAAGKAAVARAAFMVDARLSSVAREVAGRWVRVIACAKLLMALSAFLGGLIFGTLADEDYENVCFAEYLFRWSLLLALPLQCVAGIALWRLHARATKYAGGVSHFGGLAALLVLGNFAAGAGVWWGGYLDAVHRLGRSVAVCFLAAAGGQLVAGLALLLLNHRVRRHFALARASKDEVPAEQLGCDVEEET